MDTTQQKRRASHVNGSGRMLWGFAPGKPGLRKVLSTSKIVIIRQTFTFWVELDRVLIIGTAGGDCADSGSSWINLAGAVLARWSLGFLSSREKT